MTFFEIIDLITFYGVDVVVLAIATAALTQLLKTTLLKKAPNKVYTFIPFLIGVILYAIYAAISRVSFCYIAENAAYILEQGIKVGAAATVIYVLYEQFVRGKVCASVPENAVAEIIQGYVAEGYEAAAAAEILAAPETAYEIIEKYRREEVGDDEITALCRLLVKVLQYVN